MDRQCYRMLVKVCLEMDWTCAQCTKPYDAVRTSGEHSPLCHDELVDLTAPPTVDDIQPVPEPSPPPIPDRKRRLLDRPTTIFVNQPTWGGSDTYTRSNRTQAYRFNTSSSCSKCDINLNTLYVTRYLFQHLIGIYRTTQRWRCIQGRPTCILVN